MAKDLRSWRFKTLPEGFRGMWSTTTRSCRSLMRAAGGSEVSRVLQVEVGALSEDHHRDNAFAVFRARSRDDVFEPIDQGDVEIVISSADVAGVQSPVDGGTRRGFGFIPVARRDGLAAKQQLASLTWADVLPVSGDDAVPRSASTPATRSTTASSSE